MVKITSEIAEVCGIHAGDGYLRNDGKRVELDLSGNVEEKDYYNNHVIPLFNKTFNLNLIGRFFPSRNTYGFVIRDKKIIEFFHSLGFPYGSKSLNVKIPMLILKSKNKEICASFLRGLFDTDGCLTFIKRTSGKYGNFKKTHHYYPRLLLITVSLELHKQSMMLLNHLGFESFSTWKYIPKISTENLKYSICLNGTNNLISWFDAVGSKNPVKFSRYLLWKKMGFCPTNSTFLERIEILKNKKDPSLPY